MRRPALLLFIASALLTTSTAALAAEPEKGEVAPPSAPRTKDFELGPLVGVGFPRPLAIEGFAKVMGWVGAGFEYSFLPSMSIAGVQTSFKAIAADLRVFPFRGAFFIGLRGGRQWLDLATTVSAGPLSSAEAMAAATWFLNPRLGFLWTIDPGITIGIDAGLQIPIGATFSRTGTLARAGLTSVVDEQLETLAGALGNNLTPTIDLLRLGFLF